MALDEIGMRSSAPPAASSLLSVFLQAIRANSLPSFITETNCEAISKYFSVRGAVNFKFNRDECFSFNAD